MTSLPAPPAEYNNTSNNVFGDIEPDSVSGSDAGPADPCRAFAAGLLASHSYDGKRSKLTAAGIIGADHH
jgi:hypothetical protein